jgi:NAD(P)-dependent dehydrogenase (short-subunit alcohol dehydrogenase family)
MHEVPQYNLDGKVAIVTGAAHGIGEATATRLIGAGAKVVLADINFAGVESIAAEYGADEAIAVRTDVTVPSDLEGVVSRALGKWGKVDILVNNASNVARVGDRDGDFLATSMDTWDEVYAANVRGPAAACKFVLPPMIEAGSGVIVNVTSVNGMSGDLVRFAYGATKSALLTLTKYIAAAYGPKGVRCNSVAPGLIMSPPARSAEAAPFIDLVSQHTCVPGQGESEDIAETIVFLASDAARWITGQNIAVDGGLTCQLPWVGNMRRMVSAAAE